MVEHIAVFGMSFCGSTVFNYCLGSMRGCKTINESHWLVDNPPSPEPLYCLFCGPQCKILNAEFRGYLIGSASHYEDIRSRLGCQTLISSDKDLLIYDRLAPGRNYVPILLFKDPAYQFNSYLKATSQTADSENLKKYLGFWATKHLEYLERLDEMRTGYVIDTTRFQENPKQILEFVCQKLEIQYSDDWKRYWQIRQHAIGGNYNPYTLLDQGEYSKLEVSKRRPKVFSDSIVNAVQAHSEAQEVLSELTRRLISVT